MGLLDELVRSVLAAGDPAGQGGGTPVTENQLGGLAQAVIAMLDDPRVGGVEGLLRRFQESGLGDVMESWIGTGQNRPIDPSALERALPVDLSRLSAEAGLPPQQGGSVLAQLLPVLIDQLTPQGRLPEQNQLGDLAGQLLRGLLR